MSEFRAKLGLNIEQYKQGLRDASKSLGSFVNEQRAQVRSAFQSVNTKEAVKGANELGQSLQKVGIQFSVFRFAGQAISAVLEHARNLTGVLDENSAAAKRFALSLDGVKTGMLDIGTKGVGWFTKGWEGVGDLIARTFRGDAAVNLADGISKAADEAEERLRKFKETNDPEKLKATRAKRDNIERDTAMDAANNQEKLVLLKAEEAKYNKIINDTTSSTLQKEEAKTDLAQTRNKITAVGKDIEKERKELAAKELEVHKAKLAIQMEQAGEYDKIKLLQTELLNIEKMMKEAGDDKLKLLDLQKEKEEQLLKIAQSKARIQELEVSRTKKLTQIDDTTKKISDAKSERSGLSLQELSSINPAGFGISMDVGDQARKAKEVLELEAKAEKARLAGDVSGFEAADSEAQKLKAGLSSLRPSERADPYEEMSKDLKQQIVELQEINKQLGGKFKSQ